VREVGAGNPEVGGLGVADALDRAGDGVQQQRECGWGMDARYGLMSELRKVARPSGASTPTSGIESMFAGSAKTVARWK
jgi:hypothetical protein